MHPQNKLLIFIIHIQTRRSPRIHCIFSFDYLLLCSLLLFLLSLCVFLFFSINCFGVCVGIYTLTAHMALVQNQGWRSVAGTQQWYFTGLSLLEWAPLVVVSIFPVRVGASNPWSEVGLEFSVSGPLTIYHIIMGGPVRKHVRVSAIT